VQTWRRLGCPRPGPVLHALDEAVREHEYTLDDTELVARTESSGAGWTWRVAQAPVRRAPHGLTACVLAAGLGPPLTVMVPLGAFAAAVSPAFRAWFLAGPRGFPLLRPPRHFVALVGAVACRPRAAAPVRTPRVRCAMALT